MIKLKFDFFSFILLFSRILVLNIRGMSSLTGVNFCIKVSKLSWLLQAMVLIGGIHERFYICSSFVVDQ